jgi:hypothetical protein
MKPTPGPWVIDWNVSRLDVFSSDAATLVATLRRSTLSDGIDKTAISNARLIAAAPDLLEALRDLEKEFRRVFPIYYYSEPWAHDKNEKLKYAQAIIAKATGEQQ